MADRVLQVRFVGNTSDLTGNVDGVTSRFGVLAKGVAAAGAAVTAGLLGAGKALFDMGSTFDEVSDTIRVKTGASGEALEKLNDVAKTVGTQVPADFADVGTAVAELSQRLGTTGKELGPLSVQILELSRLTGTELSANIEGITRVFGDWSIKTEDQGKAMDKLFRASQATGVGIDRLSENVVKFGGPLRTMGFSFEQSLAMLGKFEKEGVNTELVLGSMRIALGKFAKAGKDPVTAFREVVTAIKNAGSAAEANKLALQTFGAKAGVDMALAIREGRFAIDDLVGTITNGSDTINKASLQTMDFAEQWQMFKNKVMVALEPITARVFGMIGEKTQQLSAWFDENQATVMAFVSVLATGFGIVFDVLGNVVNIAVQVGAALSGAGQFINDHWTAIMVTLGLLSPILVPLALHFAALGVAATVAAAKSLAAFVSMRVQAAITAIAHGAALLKMTAQWTLMAATATGRALVIAAAWIIGFLAGSALAIATMVATAVVVVAKWIWMGAVATAQALRTAAAWTIGFVAGSAVAIATMVATAATVVAQWVIMAAGAMARAAVMAAAWFVALGPIGWVIAAVVGLVALIIANWETVKRWTIAAWNAVSGAVAGAWGWIRQTVSDGVGAAIRFMGDMVGWVAGLPGRILGALGNVGRYLWIAGVALVSGFWDGIVARWNQMIGWLQSGIKRVRDLFPFSPAKEGPFSGRGYVSYSGEALTADFAASIRKGLPGIVSAVEAVVGAAQGGFNTSVTEIRPVAQASVAAVTGAASSGPLNVSFNVSGGADQAVATLIMELIRTNKIQLSV